MIISPNILPGKKAPYSTQGTVSSVDGVAGQKASDSAAGEAQVSIVTVRFVTANHQLPLRQVLDFRTALNFVRHLVDKGVFADANPSKTLKLNVQDFKLFRIEKGKEVHVDDSDVLSKTSNFSKMYIFIDW